MKSEIKYCLMALGAGLFLFSAPHVPVVAMGVVPKPTIIYVHGFNFGVTRAGTVDCHGKSTCPSYWTTQDKSDLVVHVGYDGRFNPLELGSTRGVTRMLQVLNSHCRRDQGKSCRIVNHSMGGMITGYVMANYNRIDTKTNTHPYNILYVSSLVSAEGGSELASAGNGILGYLNVITFGLTNWLLSFPDAVRILAVGNARRAYDHNRNNGVQFYHVAGNVSVPWYNPIGWILPGKHDTVVAMHTTCSYRDVQAFSQCGGETVSTYFLWFETSRKTYAPHTGHHAHSRHSKYGVDVDHTTFPEEATYTNSSL